MDQEAGHSFTGSSVQPSAIRVLARPCSHLEAQLETNQLPTSLSVGGCQFLAAERLRALTSCCMSVPGALPQLLEPSLSSWRPPSALKGHLQLLAMWPSPWAFSQHDNLLPQRQKQRKEQIYQQDRVYYKNHSSDIPSLCLVLLVRNKIWVLLTDNERRWYRRMPGVRDIVGSPQVCLPQLEQASESQRYKQNLHLCFSKCDPTSSSVTDHTPALLYQ